MKALEIREPITFAIARNLRGLIVEMRPLDWSKNLLVFSGLIFSRSLTDPTNLLLSIGGFATFCAASSSIYLFNDLCDLKHDREHPVKRERPLAAGLVNINLVRVMTVVLLGGAIAAAIALNISFALVIGVYLITCLAYSLKLKDIVILDVILVASGFVLRAASGALLIGVEPSEWLVLCTSMVALLIGFGKRRHELALLQDGAHHHRRSLGDYSIEFLDAIMTVCAGAAVLTYALYTRADETVARVGSHGMLLTIPFVLYGVFRYLFLIHKRRIGGDPVQMMFRDRPTLINLALWVLTAGLVIYLPKALRLA
ncbi:MAG: decaprenyl-phosphate phosphoribosyltransferase [Acidobacteria bacterium]|nr:decaprenyl-phosphate phosphoribosyltransferase [Acidobacteriota bacterium]